MAGMFFGRFSSVWLGVMLLSTVGCVTKEERTVKGPAPRLDRVIPEKVLAGQPFQVQPGGRSALSVTGENLVKGSRIRVNGQPLETSDGDGRSLNAFVPNALFAEPGLLPVTVETPDAQVSNALPFAVLAKTGPAPAVTQLFPASAPAGKPFNEQPGGLSALGIVGNHFLPGAVILIQGEAVETSFGDVDKLSAIVPSKFLARPGVLLIAVRNPDGKQSPASPLTLTK